MTTTCWKSIKRIYSIHARDELVDLLLTVAPDTALLVRMSLLGEATERRAKLEWPEEVVNLLEIGADSPDLVDQVLDAAHVAGFAKVLLDHRVVIEGNSRSVNLAEAALVDELADCITGWVAVSDVGFNHSDHVNRGAIQLDENTVVELTQAEKLHDLLGLGGKLVDTKREESEQTRPKI